jgi:hypothetical protein
VKKRIRTALLGHRVIAIERWRVGQVDDNWVLGGILSRVTTKKRGAHVDTSRDEFSLVSRQRWERLMGRLEQSRNSRCGHKNRAATKSNRTCFELDWGVKTRRKLYFGQQVLSISALASRATTTSKPRDLTNCWPRGTFSRFEEPSMSSSQVAFKSWKFCFPARL